MNEAFQSNAFQNDAFQSEPPATPVTDFTEDGTSGTLPFVVQFTDTSDNYPTEWFWEYKRDNGEWKKLSELRNPDISFNVPGTYSIQLTASNETGSDTETKNDIITVSATPYEPYNILKDSKIGKRLNDGLTEIQTHLSVAIPAHAFHSGQEFEYTIYDTSQKDFTVVKGIIEDVERDYIDASRIYNLSGRDNGRLLIKQPYGISCAEDDGNTYLFGDVLESILTDTGVTVGRGQEELRTDLHVTNNNVDDGTRYCGSWSTKKDALDDLFENYRKQAGLNKIRWFIDFAGYLRWFEINSERMGVRYIFKSQGNLISFKPKETCREVINYVKGTWTDENNETHTVTVSDQTSIGNYGKCISPTVFTGETEAEVTEKINEELAQKKDPIFSGTLVLAGFALYEPGTQINFNDDDEYSSFLFTVVDWNYDGPSNQTTMDVTTDETVTSVPNEAELMQSVVINEISKVLSDVSIVVAKSEGSDRVIAKSETDGVSRNIRDLNSGET